MWNLDIVCHRVTIFYIRYYQIMLGVRRTVARNVSVDKELALWVERKVQKKEFASFSHAVNYALQRLKDQP